MKYIVIIISIVFLSCCDDSCKRQVDDDLIEVWVLKAAINNDTNQISYYPQDIHEQELIFEIDHNIRNSCNMHGNYSVDDNILTIYDVIFTEMFCWTIEFMEWEALLADNLYGTCDYNIDGSELNITTRNGLSFILTKKVL